VKFTRKLVVVFTLVMAESDSARRKIFGAFNFVPIAPRPTSASGLSPSPVLLVGKSPGIPKTPSAPKKHHSRCEFCGQSVSSTSSLSRHKKGGYCSVLKVASGDGEIGLKAENRALKNRLFLAKEAEYDELLAKMPTCQLQSEVVDETRKHEEVQNELSAKKREVCRISTKAIFRQKQRVGILRKSRKTIEKKWVPFSYSSLSLRAQHIRRRSLWKAAQKHAEK